MKRNKVLHSGFAHIWLVLCVVVVVALIGVIGTRVARKNSGLKLGPISIGEESADSDNDRDNEWKKGCSGKDKVMMTHLPMNIDDVATVTPYGLVAGAHVTPIDHLYFYPKEGPRDKYPVYAMADGTIIGISVRGVNVSSGEQRPPEYRFEIQHSCQTVSYFDLVTKLDQSILKEAPDAATKGTNKRIAVKAGQEVGRIGAQSLDTAVYNMDLTLPGFITPSLYKAEPWKIHTDDFFSYFREPLLSQMLAKNARKAEPRSGKIDYDQPGKLIGNWFLEGTYGYAGSKSGTYGVGSGGRGYWSGHLAIFPDAYDPTMIIVSVGEFTNGQPEAFAVVGNTPDPAKVTKTDGVIKYELVQAPAGVGPDGQRTAQQGPQQVRGVILLQVLDGEKLKVETFVGKTGAQVSGFTSAAKTYER